MKKTIRFMLTVFICFGMFIGTTGFTAAAGAAEALNKVIIEFAADAGAPIGFSPPSYEIVDLLYEFDNVVKVEDVIVNEWEQNKKITAKAPCTIKYVGVKDNQELDSLFDPFLSCIEINSDEHFWAGGYENPDVCVITLGIGEYDLFVGNFGMGTTHRLVVESSGADGMPSATGQENVEKSDVVEMPSATEQKVVESSNIVGNSNADAMPATAKPTASTVLINGKNVSFDAYNINDNNYFKLRDLAYALSGTEKQFEVGWDGEANAISLTSGSAYTPVGGELAAGNAGDKAVNATTSKIFLDGNEVKFTAYNIDGNNYFKLRDIGKTFNFSVDWDDVNNTIAINTNKGYENE